MGDAISTRRIVILWFGLIAMWPTIWLGFYLLDRRHWWVGGFLIASGLILGLGAVLLWYSTG